MWSPSSSNRTPPPPSAVDGAVLEEFAKAEGVALELIREAVFDDHDDLSIFAAFLRATPGQSPRVAERFELLELVGVGSYGQVFRARDHKLARDVAVKIMRLGDPESADREGRALAALVHPNIVRIYDQGRGDDYRWIEMEWLEGPTLYDWCGDKKPEEILSRYIEAGNGLAAMHRRGLVHRDFKANNAMINGAGEAVLVDFGLAQNVEALHEADEGRIVGALPYLAPERLRGGPGDQRADQFAFCAALWEALTGGNPFLAAGAALDARLEALQQPPRERNRIPRGVRAALKRGLAFEPEDRWPSMEALLSRLQPREKSRTLIVAGLVVMTLTSTLLGAATLAPEPGELFVEPETPSVEAAALRVLEGVNEDDTLEIDQALATAYSAARSVDEKQMLLKVVLHAATYFEDEGHLKNAAVSWWMASLLYNEFGNAKAEVEAANRRKALTDEIIQNSAVTDPRTPQSR